MPPQVAEHKVALAVVAAVQAVKIRSDAQANQPDCFEACDGSLLRQYIMTSLSPRSLLFLIVQILLVPVLPSHIYASIHEVFVSLSD